MIDQLWFFLVQLGSILNVLGPIVQVCYCFKKCIHCCEKCFNSCETDIFVVTNLPNLLRKTALFDLALPLSDRGLITWSAIVAIISSETTMCLCPLLPLPLFCGILLTIPPRMFA